MFERPASRRVAAGFSLAELLVVIAILAVAAAIAVPLLASVGLTGRLESGQATLAAELRRTCQRAATSGRAQSFQVAGAPIDQGLVVRGSDTRTPESVPLADRVTFAGGTGYPMVNGVPSAVAFVLADGGRVGDGAVAVVVSRSANIIEYRFRDGGWEQVPQ